MIAGGKFKGGLMNSNKYLEGVFPGGDLISIVRPLCLEWCWHNGSLFIFDSNVALIVSDDVNDFDISVLLYDRNEKKFIQNLYGVLEVMGLSYNDLLKEERGVDFPTEVNLNSEKKYNTLKVLSVLLVDYGDRFLGVRAADCEYAFSSLPETIFQEWDSVMEKRAA
ncbi:hypothetical protein [Marinimicrobium locisalis]|uniref:hypothetical protein n=1 Tax=Marinimicrobium locisalis TaxID=546022 RepID=UPI003221B71A